MSRKNITRRGVIKSGVATSVALAAPTIWIPKIEASQTVNVWTYANFIPKDFKKEFENETGIRIRERLVDDQGKEFNLLAAEKNNPTADICTVAGHRFSQFIDSELIAPLDVSRLKNWSTVNKVYSESDWSVVNGKKMGSTNTIWCRSNGL